MIFISISEEAKQKRYESYRNKRKEKAQNYIGKKYNHWTIIKYNEEITEKSDNIEYISKYLKPQTSGSGISPFSTKNLPKSNYKIPDEDLDTYKNIVSNFYSESILDLTHNTNNFIKSLATKRNPIEKIRADMKLKCLKTKEYIHSIGKWSEYMNYLKENK